MFNSEIFTQKTKSQLAKELVKLGNPLSASVLKNTKKDDLAMLVIELMVAQKDKEKAEKGKIVIPNQVGGDVVVTPAGKASGKGAVAKIIKGQIEKAENEVLQAGTEHGLDSNEVILAEGIVSDLKKNIRLQRNAEMEKRIAEMDKEESGHNDDCACDVCVSPDMSVNSLFEGKKEMDKPKAEKPKTAKTAKTNYAKLFTSVVENIKSEVFNIDPVNVKSCYLHAKSDLKGTQYVISLSKKVHRITLFTNLTENKPVFSYINRDARKVSKEIQFEAPANRKAMKIFFDIPASENIEDDVIDIASRTDEFLKIIVPIVEKQSVNKAKSANQG